MNNMQAVILAAGQSSRFFPLNTISHKSMVSLLGKPILEHTLLSLKKAEITDIVIVIGEKSDIPEKIGDGKEMGLHIEYVTHVGAQGMGAALLDAKDYLDETFFLLNAYHLDIDTFVKELLKKQNNSRTVVLLGKKPQDSTQFGVMEINGEKVLGVLEKPKKILDNHVQIVGIYLLNKTFLSVLKETPMEHYHFEKALDIYAKNETITYHLTKEKTLSLKYVWDLLTIKNYLFERVTKSQIDKNAIVSKTAVIEGKVIIEKGAIIMEGAIIKGPCYIGERAKIGNYAVLRNGVDVEEDVVIGARMEAKNSIFLNHVTTHSGFLGDSVVGTNTKIAAYVCSANARLDRQNVTTIVKDEKVNTGLRHVGVLIGNDVNIGIRVSSMPGIIIGNNSIIGPSTTVMKNIAPNTKFYTKFCEVIEDAK